MFKIYTYQKCSTCRKATKFLDAKGIAYEEHPIRETPPPSAELARMLAAYEGKGADYADSEYAEIRLSPKGTAILVDLVEAVP